MKLDDAVRRVIALGLPNEQFAQVILLLADIYDDIEGLDRLARIRENGRARAARRRAMMDVTDGEWQALRGAVLRRDGEVCAYCGDTNGPHHIDHKVPLSRGGASILENLVVACYACNASKQDKLVEEWSGR